MKKYLSVIYLLFALALPIFAFGNGENARKNERIYIRSDEVICSEKGIFINHRNELLRAKSIAFDESGIYVLKGWLFGDNENDEPRGAHNNNRRPSSENRHQEANARRAREQAAAQRRQEEARRRGRRGR